MSFRKPFRAVPVRLGQVHRAEQRRWPVFATAVLAAAAAVGIAVGTLAGLGSNGGVGHAASLLREAAASHGLVRKNTPVAGAYYSGCDEARAAGVAPLYAGEPGYRPEMDGDDDGVACEPFRGR